MGILTPGHRIAALLAGAAIALAAIAATFALLPPQGDRVQAGKDYGYVYSGAKSSSPEFVAAATGPDTMLLLGSSELSTPPSLVPEVPANVFGVRDCGVSLMCLGEAYDQSLWHSIAAGALAPDVACKDVAIIVSPSWFSDGGLTPELFSARFSYPMYRACMRNGDLSPETRGRIRARAVQMGVQQQVADAGAGGNLIADVNDAAYAAAADLKLRNDLAEVSEKGFSLDKPANAPDFDALWQKALADAKQRTSSNGWGMDDATWDAAVGGHEDQIRGALASETYGNEAEYDDFDLFLTVCEEAGLRPLVIVAPVHGDYYDLVGVNASTRRACYDRVLGIAAEHGARVADFSDREYELYFLHDQVHFGWLGWVDACRAIYGFRTGAEGGAS